MVFAFEPSATFNICNPLCDFFLQSSGESTNVSHVELGLVFILVFESRLSPTVSTRMLQIFICSLYKMYFVNTY
jgi:hypothetical protein